MAKRLKSDGWMFGTIVALLVIGLAWVQSATAAVPRLADVPVKQGLFVALGMISLLILMRVDYHVFGRRPLVLWEAGCTAAALVFVLFFGREVKGSTRWIGIWFLGVQPSELAKFVAVFCVAAVLARPLEDREPLEPAYVQAGVLLAAFAALIILEPDFGSAIVLLAAASAMLFAAGLPYRWVAAVGGVVAPLLLAIMFIVPYTRGRLMNWLAPYDNPLTGGYQAIQSYIAIGTGGLVGRGFQEGLQKMFYLPESHNDYIFSVIAEETGLVGACVVVAAFALIVARGLLVGRRAPDAFGSLVAVGITTLIGFQALLNLGVVTGLTPAKGIPLPFVSAGGSSMVVSLAAMGVLLNISQQASATE
jgi:cell division protein FtsW